MLNEILRALGGYPAQTLPEDTTGRQFLLNEIEAAMNKNKWENDTNYFLVVGGGKGQLIHGLQQVGLGNLEEQEEKARILIARYPKLLCVIDTDITSVLPLGDS